MTGNEQNQWDNEGDLVDLWLLALIGVVGISFLIRIGWMLREPYDTIMYVHFLWRWEWIAIGLVAAAVLVGLRVWWRPKGPSTRRQRRRLRGLDVAAVAGRCCPARAAVLADGRHRARSPSAGSTSLPAVCHWRRSKPYPAATRVNYLLYLPAEYKESQKWPLVVYLHGGGASGENLLYVRAEGLTNQIERGKHFPFILLSPQSLRRGWDPELIVALIEHVSSTLPVDRDRVYLTGCSMGGFGTWNVASRRSGPLRSHRAVVRWG